MTEDTRLRDLGTKGSVQGMKVEDQSAEERKLSAQLQTGFLGDSNDYSESMLLGQFPDNFDVSDACGWMNNDDYTDYPQQKRFEVNDEQQMMFESDNRLYNQPYAPQMNTQHQAPLQMPSQQQVSQGSSQHDLGMGNINQQIKSITNNAPISSSAQQQQQQQQQQQTSVPLQQQPQTQKIQDIVLSSSQYNQQLHEMHLHHLEQISHTTNSSDYYNRPLQGPRSVLPIDSMNHETGMSTEI